MKFVIYGVGAIGGVIAAKLALSGAEVVGIARGPQLAAIRDNGLLLRTPDGEARARFGAAGDPDELPFAADDVIILAMKTQDTPVALQRLRAAGVTTQAIVCAQNGVTNERFALRRFPNVYAMTVMMPSTYSTAGEVSAFASPLSGILDLGRYPSGSDETAATIADALAKAGFASEVDPHAMQGKYGKLLLNLANIVDAALVPGDHAALIKAARDEAEAVYQARHQLAGRWRRRPAPAGPDAVQAHRRGGAGRLLDRPEPRPPHRLDRNRLPQWRNRAAGAAP